MPYPVPTFIQIRNRYLQAVANQRPDAAIGPDSDHYVRGNAIAAVLEDVYAHQAWVSRQAFPDLADADLMEKMANQRAITRKPAVAATGIVRFAGAPGATIPAGQQVFIAQGGYYATTASSVVGAGGTLDLAAAALVVGASGNLSPNTAATVNAAPAGVASVASILSMTSGADAESDESLLARLLLWIGEEAQGGNDADYKRWALSVPGVVRAYVFSVRRGTGTVDVVPMPLAGMPSAALLSAVQAVLEVKRPIGMRNTSPVLALAPTAIVTPVTATVSVASGYTLQALIGALTQAIDSVFAVLAPGETLVRAELIAAVMNVRGVTDVTLALPAGNVTSSVGPLALEIVMRGALTLN